MLGMLLVYLCVIKFGMCCVEAICLDMSMQKVIIII